MNNRMIERALVFAVKELKHVSQMQPRERVFQEAQLQCARYRYFRNQHMSVHAEAGYPDGDGRLNGGRLKCDLVVSSRSKNQMWIELAIASHPDKSENRRVLRYKPGNIKKWKDDIGKLTKYAPKSARKIFWVLGLFDGNPQNGAGECEQE